MAYNVTEAIGRDDKYRNDKRQFMLHWQLVCEYVLQRKAQFTTETEPGAFINSDIWDATAPKAAELSAAALQGYVWPDNRSFSFVPAGPGLEDDQEVKEWFEFATNHVQDNLDDAESGFDLALSEFMLDYMVLGTPAIYSEEGINSDYRFEAWNVLEFSIDEGAHGLVNVFFRKFKSTIRSMVEQMGDISLFSKETQKLFEKGKLDEKIEVLHIIEPRQITKGKGRGKTNMPIASVYIEVKAKHVIKEGGYEEDPAFCVRASKRIGEIYGRSPAMTALPEIQELNAVMEAVHLAMEKSLDPPMALYDDGTFGAGTIDTSAGALNVIKVGAKLSGANKPLQAINDVGEIQSGVALAEMLKASIKDAFYLDRLLDFNNEAQMTAYETMVRKGLRSKGLGGQRSRLYSELFTRLLTRCFNMSMRKGSFGYVKGTAEYNAAVALDPTGNVRVVPDKIANLSGKKTRAFKIVYKTEAMREMQADQAQGIINIWDFAGVAGATDETVKMKLNGVRSLEKLGEIYGVPPEIFNSVEELQDLQNKRVQAEQLNQTLDQGEQMSTIAKNAAAAAALGRDNAR